MTATVRPGLTPNMIEVLDAIIDLTGKLGRSPAYSEIATALNIRSKGRIAVWVRRLRDKGYITYVTAEAYSIRVIERKETSHGLSPRTQALLEAYCRLHGESEANVIDDAVALFIDQREGDLVRENVAVLA